MSTAAGLVVSIGIGLASAIFTAVTYSKYSQMADDVDDITEQSVDIPSYTEGRPIPLAYGLVMVPGTIIWMSHGTNYNDNKVKKIWLALCSGNIKSYGQWNNSEGKMDGRIDTKDFVYGSWLVNNRLQRRYLGIDLHHQWLTDSVEYPYFRYNSGAFIINTGGSGDDSVFNPACVNNGGELEAIDCTFIEGGEVEHYNPAKVRLGYSHVEGGEEDLQYGSRLPGIAHVYLRDLVIPGGNIPRMRFEVLREIEDLPSGLTHRPYSQVDSDGNDLGAHGVLPGTIIYDLLTNKQYGVGIDDSDIDIPSFEAANNYYWNMNYGLNIVFEKAQKAREAIAKIETLVGCKLIENAAGKLSLQYFTPEDTPVKTLTDDDLISYKFTRQSWDDTYNDFRADATHRDYNYQHSSADGFHKVNHETDYINHMVQVKNEANITLTGTVRQKNYDLSAFQTLDIASKRLTEIMKKESQPKANATIDVNIDHVDILEGDLITVSSNDYGSTINYRVLSREIKEKDENVLTFALEEENYYISDEYQSGGESYIEEPQEFSELQNTRIVELPHILDTFPYLLGAHSTLDGLMDYYEAQTNPSYMVLVPKPVSEPSVESVNVHISSDDAEYSIQNTVSRFSTFATVSETYPSNTYTIDDTNGLLITIDTNYVVMEPFEDLSRSSLFNNSRLLLVNNEIMTFQDATIEGENSYRLTGVVRGMLWTDKEEHGLGSGVYIINRDNLSSNMFISPEIDNFYYKLQPQNNNGVMDISNITSSQITTQHKSAIPQPPRVKAVRSGSTVTITILPINYDMYGAGARNETYAGSKYTDYTETYTTQKNNETMDSYNTRELTIVDSEAFTYKVSQYWNGRSSDWVTVEVGTNDGNYYSG